MPAIKTRNGVVLTKNGLPTCKCCCKDCDPNQLSVSGTISGSFPGQPERDFESEIIWDGSLNISSPSNVIPCFGFFGDVVIHGFEDGGDFWIEWTGDEPDGSEWRLNFIPLFEETRQTGSVGSTDRCNPAGTYTLGPYTLIIL